MAITSANPDNNSTTKTALSFGPAAVNTDENADGEQSLRAEFTAETNTAPSSQPRVGASLSEYYLGSGVIPRKPVPVGSTYTYGDDRLKEYKTNLQWTQAYLPGGPAGVVNEAPSSLDYVRRVTAAGAASAEGIAAGWNEGDLLFAYNYSTQTANDYYGYSFKIPNGTIGEEYERDDNFMYTTGADASAVPVLFTTALEIFNIIGGEAGNQNVSSFWLAVPDDRTAQFNVLFDRYYIKRRVIAAGNEEALTPINSTVPEANPDTNGRPTNAISFSNLYGTTRFVSENTVVTGHDSEKYGTIGTQSNYIHNSYPTTISTDGQQTRSGNFSATSASNAGTWRTAVVPMKTVYVDPAVYLSGTKFKWPVITYRCAGDADPGGRRVDIKNVGIKIAHEDATPVGFASDSTFVLTGADGQNLSTAVARTIASSGTFSADTSKTGTFIISLTFNHYQTLPTTSYPDPDLNIRVDDFVIEWESL